MLRVPKKLISGNTSISKNDEVDNFLSTVESMPPSIAKTAENTGQLIFSLDATASRQATWDRAAALQGDMFTKTRGLAELNLQLVYFRGYNECRASPWLNQPQALVKLMGKISCSAGHTQIERVLKHALAEAKIRPVHAMVYIGDCVEEDIDTLGNLAGQLKLLGLPVFVFQEGFDPTASMAFAQIAALSGGAHCRFDQNSSDQLAQLLNAVAVYATGGREALQRISGNGSRQASLLLEQLR